jgi:hypothetical protein
MAANKSAVFKDLGRLTPCKEFVRVRVSEKTFERLTLRRRIDGRFVSDLNEALLDENLLFVFTADTMGC